MKNKNSIEIAVGLFLLLGLLSLAYLSINLGGIDYLGKKGYIVYAEFSKTGGLKTGAPVEIAGVEIGSVKSISLNSESYQANVEMTIHPSVKLQDDSIASIKTKGLLGERYVQISPGGSPNIIVQGGRIRDTESAIDVEELISKYAFGDVK